MEKESLELRRKWVFRSQGARIHLIKKPGESSEHVFLKAFLWARYRKDYPGLEIEKSIGDRYKPDAIAFDPNDPDRAVFWAEAGQVKPGKVISILRRFPGIHFVLAKWGFRKEPLVDLLRRDFSRDDRIINNRPQVDLFQVNVQAHIHCILNGEIRLVSSQFSTLRIWPMDTASPEIVSRKKGKKEAM